MLQETNIPIHAPLYPSDLAYFSHDCRGMTVICTADEAAIRNIVSQTPFTYYTNKIIIEGGVYNQCSLGDYAYSGVVIPVMFENKAYGYYTYSYMDNDAAIVLGREPWGYPKKWAQMSHTEKDGQITNITRRADKDIIFIQGTISDALVEEPMVKAMPHILLQLIPEADGKSLLVRRVLRRDASQLPTRELQRKMLKDIKVDLVSVKGDPLVGLGIGEVLQGFFSVSDFYGAPAEVLRDYKKD